MRFFVGLHNMTAPRSFASSFISINRLRQRKAPLIVDDWIMDSGAFTELSRHGGFRYSVHEYAGQIHRWSSCGNLLAAVSQDLMCEPFILSKTGLTVREHQKRTVDRFHALTRSCTGTEIMPVLQGYHPDEYAQHIEDYGELLTCGKWTGVGSVCKRNGDPRAIEDVLLTIHRERPDLRLHGFGVKTTALASGLVWQLLYSADSMAWSFHARINGRNASNIEEAKAWIEKINTRHLQWPLQLEVA
jgi:hypothetical protein